MGKRNSALLVVAGGLAGLITWLVSEPFVTTIRAGQHYSFGSFYGWFGHFLFGALTAGALALTISKQNAGWLRALLACALGFVIGGILVCFADAGSDLLWIQIRASSIWLRGESFVGTLFWNLVVAFALALGVAIATNPTPARLKRTFLAALIAGGIGFGIRFALAPLEAIILLNSIDMADLAKSGKNLAQWHPYSVSRLFDFMGMGISVGLVLGFCDNLMRRAWIRVMLATNETRDYPLDEGLNRIGSAEGIEVSLFGDRTISPIHTTIHPDGGNYFISDQGSATGTFLNGQPIRQTHVMDGDEIRIGRYTMQFRTKIAQQYYTAQRQQGNVPLGDPSQYRAANHRLIDPFGNIFGLSSGTTKIGRDPDAKVNVSYDPTVSRAHAQIDSLPTLAHISDLGSTSGTLVNGLKISTPTALSDGDKIKIGDTTFTYRN